MTELMTTAEAADVMGLHPSTVRRMCERGKLKAQWCDTLWAIDADDVYDKMRRRLIRDAQERVRERA